MGSGGRRSERHAKPYCKEKAKEMGRIYYHEQRQKRNGSLMGGKGEPPISVLKKQSGVGWGKF